jgi:hypothetical protein
VRSFETGNMAERYFAGLVYGIRYGLVVVLFLAVAGCIASPPVQEMSDARQAIAVAKEAGAQELAAAELGEAEAYLNSAQRKLSERSYSPARRDALLAKEKALDALARAESSVENESH